ncbi:hypothetical protein AMECASPLE_007257 [Ameca splendens]|uniref:Uncharacterized protein n=1 Tax=Ameca splendens TaxID=208324 RepID=A0ABV0XCQ3_9TELE
MNLTGVTSRCVLSSGPQDQSGQSYRGADSLRQIPDYFALMTSFQFTVCSWILVPCHFSLRVGWRTHLKTPQ